MGQEQATVSLCPVQLAAGDLDTAAEAIYHLHNVSGVSLKTR
jgi:hypothetical protein